jgi:hypothetical protein
MNDIPGRLYNMAKGYLESARSRIDEIDQAALTELQQALPYGDPANPGSYTASSDDPMQRAQARIAAARAASSASLAPDAQSAPSQGASFSNAPQQPALTSDPLATAYRVIGVSAESDKGAVDDAVRSLRERCDPSRFAAGSTEQTEAQRILARIDEAYILVLHTFNVQASRFDKLEL